MKKTRDMKVNEEFLIEVLQNRDALLSELEENIQSILTYMKSRERQTEEIRSFYLPHPTAALSEGVPSSGRVSDLSDLYEKFERRKKRTGRELNALLEGLLERRERIERVWLCYLVLPHYQHMILKRYYVEGRIMEDLAMEMKCSVKTVYMRRNAALQMLKELVESGLPPELILAAEEKNRKRNEP